ncbi:MAG: hypothetical protein M1837_007351 [Sclerophora amabilis]|nr:MAG: hypothetical protein M1837_007351 [Sclerophora amabilis]
MVASSYPSQRSSRRVAGLHPAAEPSVSATKPPPPRFETRPARGIKRTRNHLGGPKDPPLVKRQKSELAEQLQPNDVVHRKVAVSDDSFAAELKPPKYLPASNLARIAHSEPENDVVGTRRKTRRSKQEPIEDVGTIAQPRDVEGDKRNLRSQDRGSRFRSDLALFFPAYEEMISNEPKKQGTRTPSPAGIGHSHALTRPEFLTVNTKIVVVDEDKSKNLVHRPRSSTSSKKRILSDSLASTPKTPIPVNGGPSTTVDSPLPPVKATDHSRSHTAPQRVDFSSIEKAARQTFADPLADTYYLKAHRRAARREKQLRNIEKNKAQHEKDNLERLLGGLRGHDWLRVMGVSGITDSEKKEFEPKRDFFIREVSSLLARFKAWKEEEKRRKTEKEQAQMAEEEDEVEAEEEAEEDEEGGEEEEEEEVDEEDEAEEYLRMQEGNENDGEDFPVPEAGDPPDENDVDAWAARQLHQEAISATGRRRAKLDQPNHFSRAIPFEDALPLKPFTSFYSKPYLRAAAIGKHRRSGRSATAFGQPVPEVFEEEFQLPADILTQEAMIANARSRRRMRRESKETKEDPPR